MTVGGENEPIISSLLEKGVLDGILINLELHCKK